MKKLLILAALLGCLPLRAGDERPVVPPVICPPADNPSYQTRVRDGIPSIAVSEGGRMWVTWYSSRTKKEDETNYVILSSSLDGGRSWQEVYVCDPDEMGPRRTFDPQVWVSPDGLLRWIWTDRLGSKSTMPVNDQLWMMTLDAESGATVEGPRMIARGVMLGKPIVLSDGAWLFPVSRWKEAPSACFYATNDAGKTFEYRGGVTLPKEVRQFDEHNVLQRKDGSLHVYMRSAGKPDNCLWEADSKDSGYTWTKPRQAAVGHLGSRIFVTRLSSGNWLMVKHGGPGEVLPSRSRLTAMISKDEGRSWKGNYVIDPRDKCSYPDGQQTADGLIYVISDYDRAGAKEISFVCFKEGDVLSKSAPAPERRLVSGGSAAPQKKADVPEDIMVNSPDYIVFVPKQPQDLKDCDPFTVGDRYNDHFQVLQDPGRGLTYAFWTQATRESRADQHIAFSKSRDGGKTWTEPVILAGGRTLSIPSLTASWQQPMLSKSGRLYCLWNQQTTSAGPHCGVMFGFYSDDGGDTWSTPKLVPLKRMDMDPEDPLTPPSWCNWQRPLRLGEGGKYLVGCSRHGQASYDSRKSCKVEFWQFDNIDDDPEIEDIRISYFGTNKKAFDATTVQTDEGYRPREGDAVEEASIVGLPDGRLFALMRSSVGHPLWSVSSDHGRTWSRPKVLRDRDGGKPYLQPRSPCPMYDWGGPEAHSGKYFALIHNTFDFNAPKAYQNRGPLYLIAGTFVPGAEQPVWFKEPKLFAPRPSRNSFYTSYTVLNGEGVLWFNDMKYYLLGRIITEEWWK